MSTEFSDQAKVALYINEVQSSIQVQQKNIKSLREEQGERKYSEAECVALGLQLGSLHSLLNSVGMILNMRCPNLNPRPSEYLPKFSIADFHLSVEQLLDQLLEQLEQAEQGLDQLRVVQADYLDNQRLDNSELADWLREQPAA